MTAESARIFVVFQLSCKTRADIIVRRQDVGF
jgi:hypothetical protein